MRELLTIALYVLPFSFLPFITFLQQNAGELTNPGSFLIRALCIWILFTLIIFFSSRALRLPILQITAAAVVFLLSLFHFREWLMLLKILRVYDGEIILWFVITSSVMWLGYRFARSREFRRFLILTGYAWVALPAAAYIGFEAKVSTVAKRHTQPSLLSVKSRDSLPNVYVFILDGYARDDTLKRVFGYDNSHFESRLKDLGFVVSKDTYANYPTTFLSLSSMLDMDYVTIPEGGLLKQKRSDFYETIANDNQFLEALLGVGYSYVYAGFVTQSCPAKADACLKRERKGIPISDIDQVLLNRTPIPRVLNSLGVRLGKSYFLPLGVTQQTLDYQNQIDRPTFLLAHIQSPHNGELFTENCELRTGATRVNPNPRKTPEGKKNYIQEIRCVNRQMIAAAQMIIEKDPDSLILILSDHGSVFTGDLRATLEHWTPQALNERYGVLWAIRRSPGCMSQIEEPVSLIQTSHYVLSCLDGRPRTGPEDRFFYLNDNHLLEEINCRQNELLPLPCS